MNIVQAGRRAKRPGRTTPTSPAALDTTPLPDLADLSLAGLDLAAGDPEYLYEVLALLYPQPCVAARTGPHRPGAGTGSLAEYLVLPHVRRPRLLVPTGDRRAAATAVRRYAEPVTRLARIKREAVVAALRTGASAVLLRDRIRVCRPPSAQDPADTVEGYLCSVLAEQPVISIGIGSGRGSRMPVLQLHSARGDIVGFAKVGSSEQARTLVRTETAALSALAVTELQLVTVPRVVHAGQWRENDVLVQSALPVWRPRVAPSPPRLAKAMREIALCCGSRRTTLGASMYRQRLTERLAALAGQPDGTVLARISARIIEKAEHVELTFGAWHGDWAPWHMATLADTLLLWDWERFALGVPLGFDAVHHELQRRIQVGQAPMAATKSMLERCRTLLTPFGVHDDAAQVTALLYLLELATRYAEDRRPGSGGRLAVLGSWLLPPLQRGVDELCTPDTSSRARREAGVPAH